MPRALSWRFGLIGLGIISVFAFKALFGGSTYIIQIEFGMFKELEGTEVVIDGELAGTLKKLGGATRTGFKVKEGSHEVMLRHPDYRSLPTTVQTGTGGERVMLMMDFETRRGGTYLVLHR